YTGTRTQSLNPDPIYPQFGPYSAYNSQTTTGYILPSGEVLGITNTAYDTMAGSPVVNDFFQNAAGATPIAAFAPSLDSYATVPNGDIPLRQSLNNSASPYATVLSNSAGTGVLPSTTFDANWEPKSDGSNANNCGYSWSNLNNGQAHTFNGFT